jgi:hypothetical protein
VEKRQVVLWDVALDEISIPGRGGEGKNQGVWVTASEWGRIA